MQLQRHFGDGWLEACSRRSPSFVAEIVERKLAEVRASDEVQKPKSVEPRDGIHYGASTNIPVALVTHLHFERRYDAELLTRCFTDLTPIRIERALEWAVQNPMQVGRERAWLLGHSTRVQAAKSGKRSSVKRVRA